MLKITDEILGAVAYCEPDGIVAAISGWYFQRADGVQHTVSNLERLVVNGAPYADEAAYLAIKIETVDASEVAAQLNRDSADALAEIRQWERWPARAADPGATRDTLVGRDHAEALVENIRRSMGDTWAEIVREALAFVEAHGKNAASLDITDRWYPR